MTVKSYSSKKRSSFNIKIANLEQLNHRDNINEKSWQHKLEEDAHRIEVRFDAMDSVS